MRISTGLAGRNVPTDSILSESFPLATVCGCGDGAVVATPGGVAGAGAGAGAAGASCARDRGAGTSKARASADRTSNRAMAIPNLLLVRVPHIIPTLQRNARSGRWVIGAHRESDWREPPQ